MLMYIEQFHNSRNATVHLVGTDDRKDGISGPHDDELTRRNGPTYVAFDERYEDGARQTLNALLGIPAFRTVLEAMLNDAIDLYHDGKQNATNIEREQRDRARRLRRKSQQF